MKELPPFGKIIIDNDGETFMSLGVVDLTYHKLDDNLAAIRLMGIGGRPYDNMIELRPIYVDMLSRNGRYVVQDKP